MLSSKRLRVVSSALLAGALATTAWGSPARPLAAEPVAKTVPSTKHLVLSTARTAILGMSQKTSGADTMYLANDRYRYVGVACLRCELGPAVAAAALFRRTGDPAMYRLAVRVMDTAIRTNQQKDGSYGPQRTAEGDNSIQTTFFTGHLGATLFYLGPHLDARHRAAWAGSLARAGDALVARDLLTYYINGNINLAATVGLGMAWKYTGSAKYRGYYERSLAFTLHPTGRWKAFGFKVTRAGARSLGRDTAGYLAEQGVKKAGYDPDYTQFQADIASEGYLVIGDPRLLGLSNALTNQLMGRVDPTAWTLDVTGGTRADRTVGLDGFSTSSLYLGSVTGRPETSALAASQIGRITQIMEVTGRFAYPGYYQAWGSRFATLIYLVR